MKAFVIHTAGNVESKQLADVCVESMRQFSGWQPILFAGATPNSLGDEESIPVMRDSRAHCFLEAAPETFRIKNACSINHYRLFRICVALREPIAVLEHDSLCVAEPPSATWQDVLVLNAQAAVCRPALNDCHFYKKKLSGEGVTPLDLRCRNKFGAYMVPGTAAYAITPDGAKKMIAAYDTYGWEQSDYMLSDRFVTLEKYLPQCFDFHSDGLGTHAP